MAATRGGGWAPDDELLLYVIHGALHLAGYDDQTEEQRAVMYARESEILRQLGVDTPAGGHRQTQEAPTTRGVAPQ